MTMRILVTCLSLLSFISVQASAQAQAQPAESTAWATPKMHRFESQRQSLEMAYRDTGAGDPSRGTVLLLHGKNFSGTYFAETALALKAAGFRVIAPDQIGFGTSTKPPHYHYSFHQLAENTRGLLESLNVKSVHVIGHSMGGMLATRFALMFPQATLSLTLVNPIGLEDWKALGVPYASVDQQFAEERAKTPEKIKKYQLESYYDGKWDPKYEPWVEELAAQIRSPGYELVAWNQALTSDMVFTQPVVYEFGKIAAPTLLIIGQRDRTAIGKASAPPAVREQLGNYPKLGQAAHQAIRGSQLVELQGVGHLPHIEAFDRFFPPLRRFLEQQSSAAQAGANNR